MIVRIRKRDGRLVKGEVKKVTKDYIEVEVQLPPERAVFIEKVMWDDVLRIKKGEDI